MCKKAKCCKSSNFFKVLQATKNCTYAGTILKNGTSSNMPFIKLLSDSSFIQVLIIKVINYSIHFVQDSMHPPIITLVYALLQMIDVEEIIFLHISNRLFKEKVKGKIPKT